MPDELWTEVRDIVQETGIKTIPKEKKCKKAKWLSEEALKIAVKRREEKSKGGKKRYKHLNVEFLRIAKRDKKAFLSDQCKEIEENIRMGKTTDLFKKIRDTKGTFHAKMGSIKDRNDMDLTEAYAEYIMRNAGLEETQAGIKIAGRNINNFRYADDTTLMAESEEELKSLLMKVKRGE